MSDCPALTAAARLLADADDATAEELAQSVYWSLHCRTDGSGNADAAGRGRHDADSFIEALSASNRGRGPWQRGWSLVRTGDAECIVRAFEVDFRAHPGDVRPANASPGESVAVHVPNEYRRFAHGYYMALGDLDHEPASGCLRVYWNVTPAGAAPLIDALTSSLNAAQVPFRFKILSDPAAYLRCDTGVLYLPADAYHAARSSIAATARAAQPHLRPAHSIFVKVIGRGVSLAEDAGDGESFGANRSQLIADALLNDAVRSVAGSDAQVLAATDLLRGAGYDPARLYLNPGSPDAYTPLDEASR